MSLRQTSPVRKSTFLNRSILPSGDNGTAVGVPAEVRDDLEIEAGDKVDLRYDRDEGSLTIFFEDDSPD